MNEENTISYVKTVVIAVLSLPVLFFCLFPLINIITDFLMLLNGLNGLEAECIIDALASLIFLIFYFSMIFKIKKINASAVVIFFALFMFVYWGIESGFFWYGLNPKYPAWYEINMALNDIVAAAIVIVINKHRTFHFT